MTNGPQQVELSLIPQYTDGELERFDVALVNRMSSGLNYEFDLYINGEAVEGYEGFLDANDHLFVGDLLFEELNDNPEMSLYFNFMRDGKLVEISEQVRPKAKSLAKGFLYSAILKEHCFTYNVYTIGQTKKEHRNVEFVKGLDVDVLKQYMTEGVPGGDKFDLHGAGSQELDLHFDALVKDESKYGQEEKLSIQLETFMRRMENAIANGQHSMVVIHGVGSGKLKKEVHKILRDHPRVHSFSPSFQGKYGYGATEVIFK